jgi:GNAT superfamily N-acetyltransferase
MAGVKVRRAERADAQPIAEVHVQTWQDAYRLLMPQDYLDNLDVERRREGWERILAGTDWPRIGAFVAESDDGVIGFAHVCPARDEDAGDAVGEVPSIYVLASAWGTGTGRALMTAAVKTLCDARFSEATLWVLDTNARARRFYEAAGWAVDGAERDEELRGFLVREVRYRRPLG